MSQSFVYVLSPYTHHSESEMVYRAHLAACGIATLMEKAEFADHVFFSPVVHYHQVAARSLILPRNVHYWWNINLFYMRQATHAIVLQMPGWEASTGIAMELAWFAENTKTQITYYNLPWENL